MQLRVAAPALNLRSAPRVAPSTRLAVLPQGQLVTALEQEDPWLRVATVIAGSQIGGFVHGAYLEPIGPDGELFDRVQAVHLQENRPEVTPQTTTGRAFPIGDPERPGLSADSVAGRVQGLAKILDYLDVERSPRYAAKGSTTFCNVYAYDCCYLANAYVPRVWWKGEALERLGRGESVPPRYDETLRELRANDLYDWFTDYGERFAWRRLFDLDELQLEANNGNVVVIVAQRSQLGRPGHISVVVPEQPGQEAARTRGRVVRPLQSQAGSTNWKYSPGSRAWWQGAQFRAFGFWAAGPRQ